MSIYTFYYETSRVEFNPDTYAFRMLFSDGWTDWSEWSEVDEDKLPADYVAWLPDN